MMLAWPRFLVDCRKAILIGERNMWIGNQWVAEPRTDDGPQSMRAVGASLSDSPQARRRRKARRKAREHGRQAPTTGLARARCSIRSALQRAKQPRHLEYRGSMDGQRQRDYVYVPCRLTRITPIMAERSPYDLRDLSAAGTEFLKDHDV